ncbi:MAG: tetratricopeptide repeat protein, partial [Nitrospirales bacterium]
MNARRFLSLVGIGSLLVLFLYGCSESQTPWDNHLNAGDGLFQQGRFDDAEKELKAAVQLAEQFGEEDPRLTKTLTKLAMVYDAQGQYDKAEPLLQRTVSLNEKALDPKDPELAI